MFEDVEKIRPCVDFLITQKCNYRCEYCSQSKKYSKNLNHASDEVIEAFLRFLKTLDSSFEITISGGEPLCHPRFYEVLEEIKRQNLKLSVISNFSFPFENYKKIVDIMGENLVEMFVSYHSSQIKDFGEFKDKVLKFNDYKSNGAKFRVASVLSEENVQNLKEMAEFLKPAGIEFILQHMRIKNSYVKYSKEAEEFLSKNAAPEKGIKLKTFGKLCHAGEKFLLIYENGEAYRCYSSRFNRAHSVGNIKDKNFRLLKCAAPCMNLKCTCPKPVKFGMLDIKRANYPLAGVFLIRNLVYLPYYVLKNFDIIKAKIEQGKKF